MSRWTHTICAPCWNKQHPSRPIKATLSQGFATAPFRIRERYRVDEACCFCGELTSAGIYVREDPAITLCLGHHPNDPESKTHG